MAIDNCQFCDIFMTNEVKKISDTTLYENENFFVIPALGCFVQNYIVIVSKRHINSMCYLQSTEKRDLENLINDFRTMLKEVYGFFPIVFEHGSSTNEVSNSACSVMHAHMHIVPLRLQDQSEMITSLEMNRINGYRQFYSEGNDNPYVFFMDNAGIMYFREIKNSDIDIPSQVIRRWIAKDIGYPTMWDWKIYPFSDNVIATVAQLKPAIQKYNFKVRDRRLKYIYYCRAMDGLNPDDIEAEYKYIKNRLAENGRVLVNPYTSDNHYLLEINEHNADIIVSGNLHDILRSDCVIVNLSIKNHTYVGCIAEMVYAKLKGCFVIVICGDSGVENHFHTLFHADKIYRSIDELFSEGEL